MTIGKKTALALSIAVLSACGGGGGATVLNISAVEAYRVADRTVTLAYIESESPTASTLNKSFSEAIVSAPLRDYWSLIDMGGDVFEVQLKQPPKDAILTTSEGAHGLVLPSSETTVPTTTSSSSTTVATTQPGATTTVTGATTTSAVSSTTIADSTTTSPTTVSTDSTTSVVEGAETTIGAPVEEVVLLRACITKEDGRWTPANHACDSHDGEEGHGDSQAATDSSTDASHASSDTHWSYSGAEGPNAWGGLDESWSACVDGSAQSPINITKPVGKDVLNPVLDYVSGPAEILNNGHTIQANAETGSSLSVNGTTYELAHAHFHSPSEHTVDGVSAPVEVHFVNKTSDSQLAVLSVMVIKGSENKAWQPLVESLSVKQDEPVTAQLDWAAMLPADKATFRYAGSLTTPPCSEGVSWMLFKYPVELSAKQISAFKSAYSGNNRPLQLVRDREVILDTTPTK